MCKSNSGNDGLTYESLKNFLTSHISSVMYGIVYIRNTFEATGVVVVHSNTA